MTYTIKDGVTAIRKRLALIEREGAATNRELLRWGSRAAAAANRHGISIDKAARLTFI